MQKKSITKFSNNLHKPDFGPIFGSFLGQKNIFFPKNPALLEKALCNKSRKSTK